MSSKSIIYLGVFIGSFLGSGIASLLGFNFLSITTLVISTAGSLIGFYIAYKLISNNSF